MTNIRGGETGPVIGPAPTPSDVGKVVAINEEGLFEYVPSPSSAPSVLTRSSSLQVETIVSSGGERNIGQVDFTGELPTKAAIVASLKFASTGGGYILINVQQSVDGGETWTIVLGTIRYFEGSDGVVTRECSMVAAVSQTDPVTDWRFRLTMFPQFNPCVLDPTGESGIGVPGGAGIAVSLYSEE